MKTFQGLLKTMRLRQWHKNVFVFAGLVFDGKLFIWDAFWRTVLVTFCFCLISSCVYIINDLADIEKDRLHPKKRLRPLPSGQLNVRVAWIAASLLAVVSLTVTASINLAVGAVLLAYLLQNLAYSFYLKDIVIIDVMILALGFLLRVVAGVLVVHVQNFSPWLYVTVTLGALFIGFGKRRHEISLLEDGAGKHRASLEEYSLPLLDQLIGIVTTSTLLTYTFYTFEAKTALASGWMLLTTPFIFYFVARYLYLIHVKKLGGAPDELVLKDLPLLVNTMLWALTVVALLYFR
ncbi:MAG: decaprenyl-phosphate phosphoribosyltransferase [Caldilineaceae bacterium]